MNAEVIAIGTELVSGQSLDTNSQWVSRSLAALGVTVRFHSAVGDDLAENVQAFGSACRRAGLVVMTGGLGPTQDDLTRDALAATAGVALVEDPESLAAIEALFARRGRVMVDRNRLQALVPVGSVALPNRVGTAPGLWMRVGATWVACLPGVPSEMKVMFDEQLVPRLKALGRAGRVVLRRKINLFGKGESEVEAEALDLTVRGRNPEVGITAHDATISFRVTAEGADAEEAERLIAPTLATIRQRFESLVIGEGADDLPQALAAQLARTGATIAVAESCTGGLAAQLLTEVPGISAYFPGGVVTYADAAKADLLGVDPALIAGKGAVSPEVAAAMASGVRDRLHARVGLAITGVAGPTGGTAEKPVGLVYLGLATDRGVETRRLDLGPEQPRDVIRLRSAKNALNWVRLSLRDWPDAPTPE